MLSKGYYFIVLVLIGLALVSCEKEIDIDVKGGENKLVVDASIRRTIDAETGDEQGEPPIIILTKSISFFGDIDSTALSTIFIHDAKVTISDGNKTTELIEYDLRFAPGLDLTSAYFYSLDTSDPNSFILGEFDKTYVLTVEWQGKTYTSTSTLLRPNALDSTWIEDINLPGVDTTFRNLRVKYTDPPQAGQNNFYEVFSFFPEGDDDSYDDYFNDEVTNGKTITFSFYSNGGQKNRYGYFLPGDSIMVAWSNIDYAAYEFLNTKNFSSNSIGNPFATPVNVIGNISNGALGAFITYGTYIYQKKID